MGDHLRRMILKPISMRTLPRALHVAYACFGYEWPIIALTNVWYLLKRAGCRDWRLIARDEMLEIEVAPSQIAIFEAVTTIIHGPEIVWVKRRDRPAASAADLGYVGHIFQLYKKARLAVVISNQAVVIEESFATYAGEIPITSRETLKFYVVRKSDVRHPGQSGTKIRRLTSIPLGVQVDFRLAKEGKQVVGITGLYSTHFWTGTGWGGWGALYRQFAFRNRAVELFRRTEQLARDAGHSVFVIETTDAQRYRAARRLYSMCGMKILVEIGNFFTDTGSPEKLLIYGKQIDHGDKHRHE
jgi:hypothetical protein